MESNEYSPYDRAAWLGGARVSGAGGGCGKCIVGVHEVPRRATGAPSVLCREYQMGSPHYFFPEGIAIPEPITRVKKIPSRT